MPSSCALGLARRTGARTEKPASARALATAELTKPLALVTNTFSTPVIFF
jgi:hypothetical protein